MVNSLKGSGATSCACMMLFLVCHAFGPAWGSTAEPAQLQIDTQWAGETATAEGDAILRLEPREASPTAPGADTVEVSLRVPGKMEFTLPTSGVWRARLVREGFWGEEKEVVAVPRDVPTLSLRLFPATSIRGKMTFPSEQINSPGVALHFSETPRRDQPGSEPSFEGEALCEVEGRTVDCTLPAGRLDLRFLAPEFAPFYLWDVECNPRQVCQVGEIRMVKGGSVVGWVESEDGGPLEGATVRLTPAVAPELDDPILRKRLDRQRLETTTNARGFFQVSKIPDGTYQLLATGDGFSKQQPEDLIVVDGGEERLDDAIVMERPALFVVAFEPPLDPSGQPWKIEMLRVLENRHLDNRLEGNPSADGMWRQMGLEPGFYRLHVRDHAGSLWYGEEVMVGTLAPLHVVEIPVVETVGTVTRDDEAVPGTLLLSGEKSTIQFEVDEEGEFSGFLPYEEQFRVTLQPAELEPVGSLVLEPVELDLSNHRRKAVLDIEVPDTRIEGEVVDSDDRPVEGARVTVLPPRARQNSVTETDEDGAFEIWGIPPGDVLVSASARGEESDRTLIHVEEDSVPQRLTLQLHGNIEIQGRVVTPKGSPLAGAQIVSWPDLGSSHGFSIVESGSDVDGVFTVVVRSNVDWLNMLVRAPGFATRILRESADPERMITILVDKAAGDLLVGLPQAPVGPKANQKDAPRQPMPLLFHDGVMVPTPVFRMLSPGVRREEAALGYMTLSGLESGEYSLCTGEGSFLAFRQGVQPPPELCTSGLLAPHGKLVLRSQGPEPTTAEDGSAEAESTPRSQPD